MARPFPDNDTPVVQPDTGLMSPDWYEYFQSRDQIKVADLRDISTTAPTNGQVMIYNATTKLWVPGAN